jgi:MFS family permease
MSIGTGPVTVDRQAGAPQAFVLIFAMLMPVAGIVSLAPNLPQFLTHFAAVPHHDVLVPMILTIPALCNAVFSPFAGMLADRLGRRQMLVKALLVHSVAGLSALLLDDLYLILGTRVAVGIAETTIMTTANALLGDYFSGDERRKWLAYQSIVGSIAASSLILAGGALGTLSWRGPFLLYVLSLAMFLWAWRVTWEPARAVDAGPASAGTEVPLFPTRAMALVCAITLLSSTLYFIQPIQLGRIFAELGASTPGWIGIAMTIASGGVVLGGLLYRRSSSLSTPRLLAIVYGIYGVGLVSLGLVPDLYSAVPVSMIAQMGNGMLIPILVSWALGTLAFQHRGRGMGLWNSCLWGGQFLSPLLVVALARLTGGLLPAVLAIGVACCMLSAATFFTSRVKSACSRHATAVLSR